jgi:hypothetical protein
VNRPLSLNRWMYVEGNPVNYSDPAGNARTPCVIFGGWNATAVKKRVNEAEKYVILTSDPLDTYTAAGIAIQCAGWDLNRSRHYSGEGIAQITDKQAETEWGKPIHEYDIWGRQKFEKDANGNVKLDKNGNPVPVIRGYGLRLRCPDGELEKVLNQNIPKNAVILMKREIQLVINECTGCTSTDIYIAASLAQNGPGFKYKDMQNSVKEIKPKDRNGKYQYISRDWYDWFEIGQPKNNQDQLKRFNLVIDELIKRGWVVPFDLDTATLNALPNVNAEGK